MKFARTLWVGLSTSLLPSSYLEAVARAMATPGLDGALRDLQATLLGGVPRGNRP